MNFEAVLSWPCPPRSVFYPSASACNHAWALSHRRQSPVRVSTVVAIDTDTQAKLTSRRVSITRDPWFSGEGWWLAT